MPPEQARGPKYSESAASMMALLRYGMGTPLHRLGQLQGHLNVPVPAATQWEVVLQQVAAVSPVYEQLRQHAANGSLLHGDDTYMRILEFMGKRRAKLLAKGELPSPERTGLHTTAIVSITGDGPIALFITGRKHAGENLDTLLDNRHTDLEPPLLMCDGLQHNRPKKHEVVECNCLVHGRRKFVELLDSFPSECRHLIETLATPRAPAAQGRSTSAAAAGSLESRPHPVARRAEGPWLGPAIHPATTARPRRPHAAEPIDLGSGLAPADDATPQPPRARTLAERTLPQTPSAQIGTPPRTRPPS
jgi:hypothetical protein